MKFLKVLSVAALVALIAATGAYAETQNVKVSGDLAVRGFWRDNYASVGSFASQNEYFAAYGLAAGAAGDWRVGVDRPNTQWFMSTTELQVDADLTDNVSTCVRLLNQRDWNVARSTQYDQNAHTQMGTIGSGGFGHSPAYVDDPNEFAVDLELAYITLKNFLYSPLTVTVGRQNLWFGKGFIVGVNQRIRNAANFGNVTFGGLVNPFASVQPLSAPEYTAQNAFDSVKTVLDFDPWTLTGIYSKIWGNSIQADDGVDLWGANVGYKFDAYKGEAEGYWFYKRDKQVKSYIDVDAGNDVNTIGLRGSLDPIDILSLYAELAGQFGSYMADPMQGNSRARVAGALDVGGELRYFTDKWAWKPKFGAEYIWYSGNGPEDGSARGTFNSASNGSGTYTGWDPMFRGKSDSLIREFIGRYYYSATYPFQADRYYNSADNSFQNQHQVVLRGSLQPMDSLKLTGNINMFWNQYPYLASFTKSGGYVGTEFDCGATWDYTEDVQFGLAMGWFAPGDVYKVVDERISGTKGDSVATNVVATVKVSF